MADSKALRQSMVDRQILARGVKDARVLQAMRDVPRESFVPARYRGYAYEDSPLPIEAGQTISQPYMVALMIEAAAIAPTDRLLEIGVGSGYATAVMSRLGGCVYAIDRQEELTMLAQERMIRLGYDNVTIRTGDGTQGWPEKAPFDVIMVSACGRDVPQPLRQQLALGGRLIIPLGHADEQRLIRIRRVSEGGYEEEDLGPVRFVPLIGAQGWKDDADSGEFAP